MLAQSVIAALALVGSAAANATPFKYPLANGFPKFTSMAQLRAVEEQAGGPLPQGVNPSTLSAASTNTLQAIALEEFFEVAFFSMLFENVTTGAPGFTNIPNYEAVVQSLNATLAQEQLHALSSNGGLQSAGQTTILPCEYIVDVNNWEEALLVADDFTSSVLAALPPLQMQLATEGGESAVELAGLFSSITAQEGQQDGFYRTLRGNTASANAWLTVSGPEFLFNHIYQSFIVPGSCPQEFNITHYEILTPLSSPGPENTTVQFATTQSGVDASTYYVSYLSGYSYPFTVPISDVQVGSDNITTFTADFPFDAGFSNGLTLASLGTSAGPFQSSAAVIETTVAGPAFIQVD